jgi:hypothetical protein
MSEFDAVIVYCNEIFKDVGFVYNCVQYGFNNQFNMNRVEKEKKLRKKKDTDFEDDHDEDEDEDDDDEDIKALKKAADALK